MPQRIEDVDQIEIGAYYDVPTVWGRIRDLDAIWPVRGPLHHDAEYIGVREDHYHLDHRFLTKRQSREVLPRGVESVILTRIYGPVVRRRRKCRRDHLYTPPDVPPWRYALTQAYDDRSFGDCKVCPHRGASLRGVPNRNGVVTCPLHGLRFDAETGGVIY